ncbi:MAG TPA: hypothetical protein PLC05_03285 [bacterium]|nr:hypothetical protein [bacterium]
MRKYIVILLLFVFLLPVNVARAGFMDKIVRPISDTRMQPLYGLASHLLAKEGVSLSEWEFIQGIISYLFRNRANNNEATSGGTTSGGATSDETVGQEVAGRPLIPLFDHLKPRVAIVTGYRWDAVVMLYKIMGEKREVVPVKLSATSKETSYYTNTYGSRAKRDAHTLIYTPTQGLDDSFYYQYVACARPNAYEWKYCKSTRQFKPTNNEIIEKLDFTETDSPSSGLGTVADVPASATNPQQCFEYSLRDGSDKKYYYQGTREQFTSYLAETYRGVDSSGAVELGRTLDNCPDGVEVIKAEEEEKPGGTEEKDKPTEGAGEGGTQSADVAGAGSGPGAERAESASGQGTGTTTEGKDTPKDDKESKEKSTTTATGGADTDKAKVADEATKGLETDNKETSSSSTTTTTDNTPQQAVEELKNEIKLLRDDVAKLLSRAKPEDVQDAAEAIENKEEESSDAVKKLVEELGYLKETIVEANKALQEMVQTLKSNLTLPQLLTARNEGNPYAGLAVDELFDDARERGYIFTEVEMYLERASRWALIGAVSLNIQGAEKHYSKIIEKALFYLDKADEKCKELKDQCPTETKDEINFIKDIITALPQTKTTSASQ